MVLNIMVSSAYRDIFYSLFSLFLLLDLQWFEFRFIYNWMNIFTLKHYEQLNTYNHQAVFSLVTLLYVWDRNH